jgi:gamma-glutamyl:cysteine ligase YbdK (ATP-grasp superfamily)
VRALAGLVHALARHEATADESVAGPSPEILEEASYRAGRAGLDAELPDRDGRLHPAREVLAETLALIGGAPAGLDELVAAGGGAGLQRADRERGGMAAVLAGLIERTAAK